MKNTIIILLILVLFWGCEKLVTHHRVISIDNNSQSRISVCAEYTHSDSLLSKIKPYLLVVNIDNREELLGSEAVNDPYYTRVKEEPITIFILSTDTVAKYSWQEIVDNNKILRRIEFSEKDGNMKWVVKYY